MTKMVDVTIRIPEEWFDHFWGWYLDGGGDDGFTEGLEGDLWSNWDEKRRLLVHAKTQADLKEAMK